MAENERFLVAEFVEPDATLRAAKALREDGWSVEIHTPFPLEGLRDALGFSERRVPLAFLIGGIVGAVTGFGMQVYTNLAYPLDVGGRPLIAVPAFMLITFELMVLFSVIAGIGTMLASNHLPRLHHPLFDSEEFHLASDDRFFVSLALAGRDRDEAGKALAAFDPERIEDVGGEP